MSIDTDRLPDWATLIDEGPPPRIEVDTHAAYPALLAELEGFYADPDNLASDWRRADGEPRAEWQETLAELDPEDPTAYWCEVAYQMAKMEVWVALGTMGPMELRFRDPGKAFRQEERPPGRGKGTVEEAVARASGGLEGAREAVEHYRNLRDVLPAGIRA